MLLFREKFRRLQRVVIVNHRNYELRLQNKQNHGVVQNNALRLCTVKAVLPEKSPTALSVGLDAFHIDSQIRMVLLEVLLMSLENFDFERVIVQ